MTFHECNDQTREGALLVSGGPVSYGDAPHNPQLSWTRISPGHHATDDSRFHVYRNDVFGGWDLHDGPALIAGYTTLRGAKLAAHWLLEEKPTMTRHAEPADRRRVRPLSDPVMDESNNI